MPHTSVKPRSGRTATTRARLWRVSIIRRRGVFLGTVEAPDNEAAGLAAAEQFGLNDQQRKRLVLQEA
jgi:hypothetical protein